MSNIYFFLGDNAFELFQEKRRWVGNFTEKHGAENVVQIDATKLQMREFLDEIAASPFIAEKRLIIVNGALKWKKADVEQVLPVLHPDNLLLFICEIAPDKKGATPAGMKAVEKVAEVKKFPRKKKPGLKTWLSSQCTTLGLTLDTSAQEALLRSTGEDQMTLWNELQKLSLYKGSGEITVGDIETLVMIRGEEEVWALINLLTSGKVEEALALSQKLLDRGESPHSVWARMLWMVSQLVLVRAAIDEGLSSTSDISKATGVNPWSCRSLVPFAKSLSTEKVKGILTQFSKADVDLKTGIYKATVDAPEELESVIDACILSFR